MIIYSEIVNLDGLCARACDGLAHKNVVIHF